MTLWLAITRGDVADYVETLALVYLVLIFIRIIMSWIPRMPYNRYLAAALKFVSDVTDPYLNLFRRFIPPVRLGPGALARPVGEVSERPAQEQAHGQPEPRHVAVHREVANQQRERQADQYGHDQPAALERPERDPGVAGVRQVQAGKDGHRVAPGDAGYHELLRRLIHRDDHARGGYGARQTRGH